MSVSLKNGSITTGGTAQQALPERLGRSRLVITAATENLWVNFGQTAVADVGEVVYFGSIPRVFDLGNFPEIGAYVSVVSATTGAKYQIRET